MGLAVATELIKRGSWTVHLLDLNVAAGAEVIKALGPQSHFHQVNIVRYEELSTAFDRVFCTENRLDFVYANAGIVERFNFYEKHDLSSTPPELDTRVVDINLTAVLTTCYLALHYFRKSPNEHRSLVATASCGGIYPTPQTAMYAGTKRRYSSQAMVLFLPETHAWLLHRLTSLVQTALWDSFGRSRRNTFKTTFV